MRYRADDQGRPDDERLIGENAARHSGERDAARVDAYRYAVEASEKLWRESQGESLDGYSGSSTGESGAYRER